MSSLGRGARTCAVARPPGAAPPASCSLRPRWPCRLPAWRAGWPRPPARLSSAWPFALRTPAASVSLHFQLHLPHAGSPHAAHQLRSCACPGGPRSGAHPPGLPRTSVSHGLPSGALAMRIRCSSTF